jgi:hypothetical protein
MRCFRVFPSIDEACAFHCPKIDAVSESPKTSPKIDYCEEASTRARSSAWP